MIGVFMKFKAVLILIIVIICLSACAEVEISYTLTNDNSLSIDYSFSVFSDKDISGYISSIKSYWDDMGFTAESSNEDGVFTLNGHKAVDYESRGSAVKELSEMFTDKDSLFYNVRFTYTPSYSEDHYDLSASISLEGLIRKSDDVNIPSAEVESFLRGAENGNYKLSIALPGDIVETNADERNGQTCTWLLEYGENRDIKISTERVFDEKVSHYESLKETQSRDNLFFMIGCSAAGLLLLIIIITVSIRGARSKRSKRSEIYVERF